ncbi:Ig-like domain-containing protein [Roseisolibacter sp. H3M3-2]|uniref:Ig-like domain-containing protein n=1 Tax=Roseisolibacter sp. H3M3-2 TaxID=3031323 RepID=UPI0023DA0BBF|nr:Ig-like domain-containing protein [Roseisolibacter sp. H3M3-2]MDF1505378.1 Ig-like domain-containing protein [Roseisolibacter sp. H3M3-2]
MSPRVPLPAVLSALLVAAACGDPAGPTRCTVALGRFPDDYVVAGTSRPAAVQATCDDASTPPLRWTVSDTAVATVDAQGNVTGRAPGQAQLVAETSAGGGARAALPFLVLPPYVVVLSPRAFDLLPRVREALNLSVVPTDVLPDGFPSAVRVQTSDSCVAVVDARGVVESGRAGRATVTVRLAAAPGVRDSVTVNVGVPATARTFVARVTDAETGGAVDPRALRGQVTVLVNLLYPNTGGRVELRLGGRVVSTLLLAPPTTPIVAVTRLPLALDTRRLPDGPATLEAALVVPDLPGLPGCAPVNLSDSDSQPVTIANGG